jgi:hypothetical protein
MDLQKTREFILQQQANAEAEMAAMRQHQAEAQAKQAETQAKSDREMAAIRKLIRAGMHMIVKNEELIKENEGHLKELAKAQKITEIKLQALLDSLRRGRNGRHSKN